MALYDSLYTSETVRSESMLPYENECMINLLKHTVVLFFGVRLYFRKRISDCAYDQKWPCMFVGKGLISGTPSLSAIPTAIDSLTVSVCWLVERKEKSC